MEWTGRQQIWFLLQSAVLGFLQGFLLDLLSGVCAGGRQRWRWLDVLFGPIAGVITFFGALVIMDGQLHPILFGGVFVGMFLEHRMIGVWVCRLMRSVRGASRKGIALARAFSLRFVKRAKNDEKTPENGEKQQKMSCFFRKKT